MEALPHLRPGFGCEPQEIPLRVGHGYITDKTKLCIAHGRPQIHPDSYAGQEGSVSILQNVLGCDQVDNFTTRTLIWVIHKKASAQRNLDPHLVPIGICYRGLVGIEWVNGAENEYDRFLLLVDRLSHRELRIQEQYRCQGQH